MPEIIHTIRASGGDYTTLSAWEAAQQRDLVALDEIAVAECYDDWPTGLSDRLVLTGWTTDQAHRPTVRAAAGHGHNGDISSGFLLTANATNGAVAGKNGYVLKNLRLSDGVSAGNNGIIRDNARLAGEFMEVDSCILQPSAATSYGMAMQDLIPANTIIKNTLIYGMTRGLYSSNSNSDAQILNCTFVNNGTHGVVRGICKNTISYGHTTADYLPSLNDLSSTNNASSDATGSAGLQNITSAEFLNYAANDYHLTSSSTLIGQGIDLTSSGVTTDIDGDARTAPFDLGFDQYVAAGGGPAAQLEANAAATSTDTGAITTQIPLLSAATAVSNATGVISTQIPLSGQSASVSISGAQLSAQISLSGDILAQAIEAASLSSGAGLGANAGAQANAVGQITTNIMMSGAALNEAMAAADLIAPGSGLSAAASASAHESGLLATGIELVGDTKATATMQGGLSVDIPLQASFASASNMSGALIASITMSGDALSQALIQGDLGVNQSGLSAAALSEALSSASLNTNIMLSTDAVANAITVGALVTIPLTIHDFPRYTIKAERRRLTICA